MSSERVTVTIPSEVLAEARTALRASARTSDGMVTVTRSLLILSA